jgi:hypothetical protein
MVHHMVHQFEQAHGGRLQQCIVVQEIANSSNGYKGGVYRGPAPRESGGHKASLSRIM